MPEDEKRKEEKQQATHPTPAGQYYLMEKIAQGGMAEIFKGLSYDVNGIKKTVCIKKILPHIAASEEFIDSLIDEAKISVTLSQGNIAQVYDLGKVGDDYFMVMEFVEGRTLSQINRKCIKDGKHVPIQFLCYFMAEILNGLNYMHRRADEHGRSLGIVHRDISPQNIMVSFSGTVKIIDFGIAKSVIKIGTTDSGVLKGKFAYMSPEQARGDKIDHRSDIFSLGVIFHELLTGQRLFKADDNRQTLRNVRKAKVPIPSSIRPDLPPELDEIVMKALAKDRRDRYSQAAEMHDELVKFLYTTYPDFKPSDVASFVVELFKDELPKPGEQKEAGTPYLIIDHTSSALVDKEELEETGVAKAPIDVKKYMVGELRSREEDEVTPPTGEHVISEDEKTPVGKEARITEGKAVPPTRPSRLGKVLGIGVGAAIVLAGIAIALWYWASRPEAPKLGVTVPVGQILVTTVPPDAKVYVDGEIVGSGSPVTVTDIESNKPHMLTVQKDGYTAQTRRFNLEPDDFKDFSFTLKPVVKPTSTLAVSSTPPGAIVYLDDQETKYRTPATIPDVEPGKEHTLGLHLKNHKFWTTVVNTRPNETQNFHVQLAIDYGGFNVTSQPPGAIVLIDGAPVGQTPLAKDNLEPAKKYTVEVWLDGYQHERREVFIKSGKVEELHLELKRIEN